MRETLCDLICAYTSQALLRAGLCVVDELLTDKRGGPEKGSVRLVMQVRERGERFYGCNEGRLPTILLNMIL